MMQPFKINPSITKRKEDSLERYLLEISRETILSVDEEIDLAHKVYEDKDEQAAEQLIKSNLRFVVSVAKQYQGLGFALSDLIEEGNKGLIKAVWTYNPTKGFKFISYAVWWIRQSILTALAENGRLIRLPANHVTSINKVNQATLRFIQAKEKEPTLEELSEFEDLDLNKITTAMGMPMKYTSLDAPALNDPDAETDLASTIEDSEIEDPDAELINESRSIDIDRVLKNILTEREVKIIQMYYGLNEKETPYTYEEIATEIGLTRERVRQIRIIAENKLRSSNNIEILRKYL